MKPVTIPQTIAGWAAPCRRPAVWGCALGLLVASIAFLKTADTFTSRTRAALAQAQARLAGVERTERVALAKAQQAARARALLTEAAAAGFSPRNWDARRFNMKQVSISRDTANTLVGEITRSPDRYFAAEQFEISVRRQDESLFVTPADPASELVVTLRGSLYFKAQKGMR